jgi:hypothetical protein
VPSTDAGSAPRDHAGVAPGGQVGRQGRGRPLHHPGPVLSSERGGSGSGLDSVDGRPAALTALRRVSPSAPILVTHRRCRASIGGTYFYGSFLTDPASLPCRARPVWTERSSRIRGYLTAVMRRYIPSSPTVGRRPSPWSSTVSRSVSPGSCSRSAPRCAARCRGPRPPAREPGEHGASSRATPGPKVCVGRST